MTEEVTNEQPETQEEGGAASLNLNDLALMKQLLEVVSARNAFKIQEYSVVGALHSKLTAFLTASQKQQQPEE